MRITLIDKKDDSDFLKIKWIDIRKKEKVLINIVSLDYSKKRA